MLRRSGFGGFQWKRKLSEEEERRLDLLVCTHNDFCVCEYNG